jgi:hypothetical protein
MHPLPPSIYIPLAIITLAGMATAMAIAWWQKRKLPAEPHYRYAGRIQ